MVDNYSNIFSAFFACRPLLRPTALIFPADLVNLASFIVFKLSFKLS